MCTRAFILKKLICKFALFRPALFRPDPVFWHCAVTEKTICCRELHNLSALYPYIASEHEIEC